MDNSRKKKIEKAEQSKNLLYATRQMPENEIETNKSFVSSLASKNFQKYEVIVDNEHLQKEMKLIEWRSKTQLPLVKILFYKILQKKLLNQCSVVQVAIQNFTLHLNTLPKIGFYQILYLLKEALIGFQRLFDRFGPFEVTHKMILINKNGKCRVWFNENITLNFPGKRSKQTQHQFLIQIIKLFEQKCIRSILVIDLFDKMAGFQKLLHAIQYLETYMRSNRIVLPNRFTLNPQPLTPTSHNTPSKVNLRVQDSFNQLKKNSFGATEIKKIPTFILNLREEKKQDMKIDFKSFANLSKTNKPAFRNHSQTKITDTSTSNKQLKIYENCSKDKSNNSPISNISLASKQQNTSNGQIISRASLKNLIKQSSQQYLNPFLALTPRSILNPSSKLQKRSSLKQSDEDNHQFSQEPPQMNYLRLTQDHRNHQVSSAKDLCSVNSSQQTATTINQSSIKELSDTKKSVIAIQLPQGENEETSIFEKNGWMKRVNNLTQQDQFSQQMMRSQHQGNQMFSDDFALAGENLALLGTMGKEVKGSIVEQH